MKDFFDHLRDNGFLPVDDTWDSRDLPSLVYLPYDEIKAMTEDLFGNPDDYEDGDEWKRLQQSEEPSDSLEMWFRMTDGSIFDSSGKQVRPALKPHQLPSTLAFSHVISGWPAYFTIHLN